MYGNDATVSLKVTSFFLLSIPGDESRWVPRNCFFFIKVPLEP